MVGEYPSSYMQDVEFASVVEQIRKEDPRFDRRAYFFLRNALDYTVKEMRKKAAEKPQKNQHVTGQELLEGIRHYALEQFGPMTKTVLIEWGVTQCSDFGDLVYNLIDYNVFSKTESDRKEDFSGGYSFDDAFVKPFLSQRRHPPSAPRVEPS